MGKAPDAFRTISEVAEWLDVAPHVLRFWESKFPQVKPVKRAGGRRYYRPSDMEILGGIKVLLHEQGHTIKAVQGMIREGGLEVIVAKSPDLETEADTIDGELAAESDANVVAFEPASQPDKPANTPEPVAPAAVETKQAAPAPEPMQEAEAPPAAAAADAAPPAPKPRFVELGPLPGDTPDDAPRPLSALGLALGRDPASLADKAGDIAPLLGRLKALRAQMTTHGAR